MRKCQALHSSSNFQDIKGFQIYIRGPAPPGSLLAEKFLYPKEGSLLHLIVFLILAFYL